MTLDRLHDYIKENELGEVKKDENAKKYCSMKVGGILKMVYFPNTINDLILVLEKCKKNQIKFKVIGRGSNILFEDKEYDMLFIKISNFLMDLEINQEIIEVGAGYPFQKLAKVLSKQGYTGLEFAGGIPGTVGGAIYMNAGAHLQDISNIVQEVTYLDENFNVGIKTKAECKFAYRTSIFQKNKNIILSVKLKMKQEDTAKIYKKMSGNLEYRKEMQPLQWPSFGSVFKNPTGYHAGQLIEGIGLKGYQIGGAKISPKHANFIINNGEAKTEDVIKLIELVKKRVLKEYNIKLQTEVEIFKG
ncbi:MAG: UDP-N-acetylmuramate dehydrogenase [Mycoplasmatales bacterium]